MGRASRGLRGAHEGPELQLRALTFVLGQGSYCGAVPGAFRRKSPSGGGFWAPFTRERSRRWKWVAMTA